MIFWSSPSSPDSNLPNLNTLRVQTRDRLNIKTPSDIYKCSITAMDITHDGRILLADQGNYRIKFFDKDGHYQASLVLANRPSDISAMSNDVAVVAFNFKSPLLRLNIKEHISIDKRIENTSNVNYISCCQNKIIAKYWDEPKSVKLLDINGHVYWSRSLTDKGKPLFKTPFYTSLYQDSGAYKITIYDRIDYKKEQLIILDGKDGSIVQCIKLSKPGVAGVINGPGGSPYMCYYQMSDTKIYAWEQHYNSRQILISERHGLGPYPRFIKYSEPTNQFIVWYCSGESQNYIETFSIMP